MRPRRNPFNNPAVEAVFKNYPDDVRAQMLDLRQLVFDTAAATTGVGDIEETLRWGEPSYLTAKSKSGSIVRMHWKPADGDSYRLYFHCQTNLVATFRELYPTELRYEGNRSIAISRREPIPVDALRHCVTLALTYRSSRKARNRANQ
jgi:hypothetical protein